MSPRGRQRSGICLRERSEKDLRPDSTGLNGNPSPLRARATFLASMAFDQGQHFTRQRPIKGPVVRRALLPLSKVIDELTVVTKMPVGRPKRRRSFKRGLVCGIPSGSQLVCATDKVVATRIVHRRDGKSPSLSFAGRPHVTVRD
jgi:hypothetical protein